jgi:serine/threonine protein kinase
MTRPTVLGEGGTACVVGPLRFAAGNPELSDDKDYAGKVFARAGDCAEELALAHTIRLRMIDYFKGDVKAARKFCMTHLVLLYTSVDMPHATLFGAEKPCSTLPIQESYCVGIMRPVEHTLVSYLATLPTPETRAEVLPLVRSAVRDILDTLHAAHVYHGDVRPENVGFYTTGKGRVHICLLDFGTATVSTDGPHRHQRETDLRAAARLH